MPNTFLYISFALYWHIAFMVCLWLQISIFSIDSIYIPHCHSCLLLHYLFFPFVGCTHYSNLLCITVNASCLLSIGMHLTNITVLWWTPWTPLHCCFVVSGHHTLYVHALLLWGGRILVHTYLWPFNSVLTKDLNAPFHFVNFQFNGGTKIHISVLQTSCLLDGSPMNMNQVTANNLLHPQIYMQDS